MTQTGYGAPVTGYMLSLEDWTRRPDACFLEILGAIGSLLYGQSWTPLKTDLPDLEIVCRDYWGSAANNWQRPLIRAGFTLSDRNNSFRTFVENDQVGQARISIFVWGARAKQEDVDTVLRLARRGAAIVTIVDKETTVPEVIREKCKVFDLHREYLNESPVGSDAWEAMLDVLKDALFASSSLAAELAKAKRDIM